MKHLERITLNPAVMGGRPCVRGLRVTVGTIVGLMATGHSTEEILKLYPYLEREEHRGGADVRRLARRRVRTAVAASMKLLVDVNRGPVEFRS